MGHGKKVATFTSPHIVSINDRICINGQPIADADFIRLAEQVKEMEKRFCKPMTSCPFLNC